MRVSSLVLLLVVLLVKPTKGLFLELLCRIESPLLSFLFPTGCATCNLNDAEIVARCTTMDYANPALDFRESRYCVGHGKPRCT
jgi:hypothetical protein